MTSRATQADLVGLDVIRVQEMNFQGRHGCSPAERELGAMFRVSVELYLDTRPAAASDSLSDTADVADIYRAVREIVTGPPRHLLETIAENIADALLSKFAAEAVRVRFHKDRVPLPGPSAGYEVEILRRK
ncbi:dihydroneopterin aldolase [bacterium]|nr:dihydroneopterin aldolase [bacterium]